MDVLQSYREVQDLIWGRAVRVDRVISVVCVEWRCTDGGMMVVVECKFGGVEEIGPIVLSVGREYAQVRFKPFVV